MIKIKWDLEEAVTLLDLYFKLGQSLRIDENELKKLSVMMNNRAKLKKIVVDEKFRNITGLSMQIGCIHYIVTNGKEGLSNASKIFYKAYDLYKENPEQFDKIVKEFYSKYN